MDEMERLSELIGEIYDAAMKPSLWNSLIGATAEFVGGSGAGLFSKDVLSKTGMVYYGAGIEPAYTRLYFEKYVQFDPSSSGHYFAEIEQPLATADLMPIDEFRKSRFYLEWAKPQGLVDFISASLDKTPESVAMFGVFRKEAQGMATPDTYRRMRLIVPHIRRAVLIGRVFEHNTNQVDNFVDVIDGLASGMVLVNQDGQIMHCNSAGHALMAKCDPLLNLNGFLALRDQSLNMQLKNLFKSCALGDLAIDVKGTLISLEDLNGTRLVAHALPLTVGRRRKIHTNYGAVAAVFIREVGLDTVSPPEVVAKAFKLTPTELRVLLAIVEVGGVPESAQALGIAESTVKTHLDRLYQKTGSRRQADLVKIFASHASPLY